MIAQGVGAIVIAPADSKALVSACKRAKDAGIVVVNIDNKLDDAVLADQGIAVPFVGPDNRAGARKVGEYLAKRLKPGDQVGVLEGIRTAFNGQQRRLGFEDAMKAAGITIVDSQTAQWEMDQANRIASAMLGEHPQIKALLCCNDSMALGALAAVKSAGRSGEVLIVGFDNISAIRSAIKDGSVLATADQHADQLAVYRHRAGAQAAQGRGAPRRHHHAGGPDHGGVARGRSDAVRSRRFFRGSGVGRGVSWYRLMNHRANCSPSGSRPSSARDSTETCKDLPGGSSHARNVWMSALSRWGSM